MKRRRLEETLNQLLGSRPGMRRGGARRWPVLSVIGVLLALLGVIDIADRADNSANEDAVLATSASGEPVTWYCPAGLISQDASSSAASSASTVSSTVVVNPSTEQAGMWVSHFPSSFRQGTEAWRTYADQGSVQRVVVEPQTSLEIAVPARLIPEDESEMFLSVLVELDSPGATVAQSMTTQTDGITERTLLPCAEDVSSSWYFAAGTTTADARFMLGLFNPFPEAAVADVFFATDNGRRTPTRYEGLIVPARSALYLDVGVEATRWRQLATTVQTRSGQLVAAKLQIFDGSQGIQGVSMGAGAPAVSKQWLFPFGSAQDEPTAYLVYNPGREEARVEIDFRLDFGSAPPVELLVPAGQQTAVRVNAGAEVSLPFLLSEEIIPVDVSLNSRHWAVVRTLTEVGVVAEQLRGGGAELSSAVSDASGELGAGETEAGGAGAGEGGETEAGEAEDSGEDGTASVLDELGAVPLERRTAARAELGIAEAATVHAVFGAIVCAEAACPPDQELAVAIANPSSATISRVQINGEFYELAPRRRIMVEVPRYGMPGQGAFELQASTPVVVSPGYPNPAFRTVPEVFNR